MGKVEELWKLNKITPRKETFITLYTEKSLAGHLAWIKICQLKGCFTCKFSRSNMDAEYLVDYIELNLIT